MIGAFLACPSLWGAAPYAHTQTPGPVSAATATLHGMVTPNGEPTTAWFEWGVDPDYGQTTAPVKVGSGTGFVRVSETIDGLEPGGQYEFRFVVSNRFGVTPARVRRFTTGGRISTWGQSWFGPVLPPPNLRDLVTAAAGDYHGLAIRSDGSLVAFGYYYGGVPVEAPTDLAHFVAVAGGRGHSLAVTADGRVRAWGDNSQGQTNVPEGLQEIIAVSAGDFHSLASRRDGTVVAWGSLSTVPAGLRNVVAIASGDQFCLALGHNTPPQANPRTVSAGADYATTISLPVVDPNGDLLAFTVTVLPTRGTLHQYTEAGPGEAISAAGQGLTDPKGRVIFVPRSAEFGMAYDSFAVLANDGEFDSPEALISVNVVPLPEIDPTRVTALPPRGIRFAFAGLPEVTCYVQRSTDLKNWVNHPVPQPVPGQFVFEYQGTANETRAFFRVRVP